MCGIAGLADWEPNDEELLAAGRRLTERLRHRGPDANGVFLAPEHRIVLAHTRLSILDRGPAGAQPMESPDGRYVLVYNGEIYNHLELRRELGSRAPRWRGHSDTETLLAAIGTWGVAGALQRCRGMFALAVLDRQEATLSLARDRLGQKPLYHGRVGPKLVFASDLNAVDEHVSGLEIDRDALAGYLQHGAVQGLGSIYAGVHKVPPGGVVTYRNVDGSFELTAVEHYWRLDDTIRDGMTDPFTGSADEAIDRLDALVSESVRMRMLSDVPIGCLLSGGIDSTLVAAQMQRASDRPIQTFTAAFPGHGLDESAVAAEIARHLGTDHHVLDIDHDGLMETLPMLSAMNGEPFADPSQLPTYLISRFARRSVTVCLAGDGGDEFFGGYHWQARAVRLIEAVERIPGPVRVPAARLLGAAADVSPSSLSRRARNLGLALGVADPLDARLAMTGAWKPGVIPLGPAFGSSRHGAAVAWPGLPSAEAAMRWYDGMSFLPDLVLAKVDRASMWASLEARAPLLDHELVAFAARLPAEWRHGPDGASALGPLRRRLDRTPSMQTNKWILRQLLDRYVPRAVMDRPKQGFDPPVASWLRGDLASWAEELLSADRLAADGLLDPAPIRSVWERHRSGREDHASRLWTVLMFQAWREGQGTVADRAGCSQAVNGLERSVVE